MSPVKCCLCSQPSTDFPQDFKAVLSEIIQVFNKFLSCKQVTDLVLCQSCWLYFMRVHKFNEQLSLKRETGDIKISLLSSKIQRVQRSSLHVESEINLTRVGDFNLQAWAGENFEEKDAEVSGQSRDGRSAGVSNFASNNTPGDSSTESIDFSEIVGVVNSPSSVQISATVEEELIDVGLTDKSDCKPQQVKPYATAYENKWLPKKCTLPKTSAVVKRLSETDFIYLNKYPFQATETGFKCGLCPAIRLFQLGRWPFFHIIRHITDWHKGNRSLRGNKILQKFIEVAPNKFHYGKYTVEKTEEHYRCGECGVIKPIGTSRKARHIIQHINTEHESNPLRTYICEYCGKVYRTGYSLKEHRAVKHENPNGKFPCKDCGKMFSSRSGAIQHRYNSHRNRHKFMCETCGKVFSQNVVLRTHVASVHKMEKIKCKECGKSFGSQNALYIHGHSHTGKKYTCDICGMDFTQRYSVTRHKKTAHHHYKLD